MLRRVGYAVSTFVLVWAAAIVPLPLVEFAPGGSTPVAPLVQLSTTTTDITGSIELLTVLVREPSLFDAVQAWLSPTREVERRETVIPAEVDESEYHRLQRQQFERSSRLAVAVGLRAAGQDVTVTTRPIVLSVLPGGPSSGILEIGDVLHEVDGTPVTSAEELIEALRDVETGDEIRLTLDRGGERRQVTVTAGALPGLERSGIGVAPGTIADEVELPFDVTLDERSGIGGPSAGLMFAVAVYDLVSEEDLAAGRVIAGTGTLDGDGVVGAIGGIREKVPAAERAGADVMLVPASQAATARSVVSGDLTIVPVTTLEEAIQALRRTRG